ncbi:non-hydrolyzing UDP-N-acetylglucosamine 2-epimerase [Brevibacterium litoralis]|uniref:non-hydrolyzing UDP-N-acetylglucosamine 2-epimerase n=1 Tax=Brevibacterium litoralis TaxID=3138935 RepID=UPI0032EED5F1
MVVYGTRPEAIKVAPLIRALHADPRFRVVTVTTAQHREMLDQVNEVFGLEPDVDLDLMAHRQTLNGLAARVIAALDPVYAEHAPAAVVVQGDTTTVMAAGIAAFNREIPVVHLEAGLRSGDLWSPFPEEANRKLVSQIASLHLAPTAVSKSNLLHDGVDEDTIVVTGNTVVDALQWAVEQPASFSDPALDVLVESERPMLLLTTHRRENLGPNMENIGAAIRRIATSYPELLVVWPAHKNPRVRETIRPYIDDLENVIAIEPVGYGEFSHLIARARIVLTDSGGIQEEAPSLGKPVLVLRENTERPEAVDAGTVKLIGTDEERIVNEVRQLMDDTEAYAAMANAVNPYGDGHASARGADAIGRLLVGSVASP